MKSNNRIVWIDVLKAFSIFLIVLGHAVNDNYPIWKWVYGFHVPLFIIIAGYNNKVSNYKFKDYVMKQIKKLMIPYYLWGAVSIFIYMIIGPKLDGEAAVSLKNCIIGLLYANGSTGNMRWNLPMWFIPMFFCFNIIVFINNKIVNKKSKKYVELFVSIFICLLFNHLKISLHLPFGIESILFLCPFYFIGELIKMNQFVHKSDDSIAKTVFSIFLICFFSYLIINYDNIDYVSCEYRNYMIFLINALGISIPLIYIFSKIEKINLFITNIGKSTLMIMILHKFPLQFFEKICPIIKDYYMTNRIEASFFISIISILLCNAFIEVTSFIKTKIKNRKNCNINVLYDISS